MLAKGGGTITPQLLPFLFSASMCSKEKLSPLRDTQRLGCGLWEGTPRPRLLSAGTAPAGRWDTLSPKHFCINAPKLTSQAVVSCRHWLTLPGTGRTRTGRGRAGGGIKKARNESPVQTNCLQVTKIKRKRVVPAVLWIWQL